MLFEKLSKLAFKIVGRCPLPPLLFEEFLVHALLLRHRRILIKRAKANRELVISPVGFADVALAGGDKIKLFATAVTDGRVSQNKKAANKRALPFGDALLLAACSRVIGEPSYKFSSRRILLALRRQVEKFFYLGDDHQ